MTSYRSTSLATTAILLVLAACSSDSETTEIRESTIASESIVPTTSATQAVPSTTKVQPTAEPSSSPTSAAVTTSTPPAATLRPAVTEPSSPTASYFGTGFGPYPVGVTTIQIGVDTDRPLTVEVWFPFEASGDSAHHDYELVPDVTLSSEHAYSADAAQIDRRGAFPLVVYSHGAGGSRFINASYAEALASNGFVVIAPDHAGDTVVDVIADATDSFEVAALHRPRDVTAVVDAALDPSGPLGGFTDSIDASKIAVTGHSFGGFTALTAVSGYQNSQGAVAADERVSVVVPLAPATAVLSDVELGAVAVPMMVMVGTDDVLTPPSDVDRLEEFAVSAPMYRVDLQQGAHNTFTDVCEFAAQLEGTSTPEAIVQVLTEAGGQACDPPFMATERAHAITNTMAVAMLNEVFFGELPIDPSDLVNDSDVTYSDVS